MATASDTVSDLEDLLTCTICTETLNEPRSLHCFHNFCKVCLGKYVEGLRGSDKATEVFPCPNCRSEFTLKSDQDVGDLASSYFIKNMLEIMAIQRQASASAQRCSSCEESAVRRCMTCEMYMCEKCSKSHAMWPAMKNHDVFSVEELSNPENQVKMRSKLYCKKHKDKILEYYCETCKELSCIHCMVLNHTKENHSCFSVDEVGQKQREMLQESCTTLEEKLAEGKEELNTLSKVMESLEKNAKTAKDQIDKQKEKILASVAEKLNKQVRKMHEDVDKSYGELHGELSKRHLEIKEYIDKVQSAVSLQRSLLKRGSIEEILSSQKVIEENIKKLRNDQPENVVEKSDGDIQFVPGDIDNINYGEIVNTLGSLKDTSAAGFSSILEGEIAFIKQLQNWLGEKCKWNLCYRASRDGWGIQDFHKNSDNKGPTVVLVKANNYIFGGYTDINWGGREGHTYSNSSFLFSLRNKDNLAPFIANIQKGKEKHAIYCARSFGPWFGNNDILIMNNPHHNKESYSQFGHVYQLPSGYFKDTEQAHNLLAGEFKFSTSEIEVFC